jgi:hypothetical protein
VHDDDGWRDDGRRLTGQALKDRAVALLRRSMEKRRRYIIAMCNMAHLLSLNSSTFVEAGLLHLYAREYSGVEEVIEGWNGKWEESSDAASGSSSVAVGGAGRREGGRGAAEAHPRQAGEWGGLGLGAGHGHVYEPLEALNSHMRAMHQQAEAVMREEERRVLAMRAGAPNPPNPPLPRRKYTCSMCQTGCALECCFSGNDSSEEKRVKINVCVYIYKIDFYFLFSGLSARRRRESEDENVYMYNIDFLQYIYI